MAHDADPEIFKELEEFTKKEKISICLKTLLLKILIQ